MIALGYAGFVLVLWRAGLLRAPTGESDGQAFAAVLGLLGGLVASGLTFIGVLLKHSIDNRTEARLNLDTSIRAVELLTTPDGKNAPPTQQAGALFALAHLGQLDLALALLEELWPKDGVSASAATWIIDQGLTSTSERFQLEAARILHVNAKRLFAHGELELPSSIDGAWSCTIRQSARDYLMSALIDAIASRPRSDWATEYLLDLAVLFDRIRDVDEAPHIRASAILMMQVLLDEVPEDVEAGYGEQGRVPLQPWREQLPALVQQTAADVPDIDSTTIESIRAAWRAKAADSGD